MNRWSYCTSILCHKIKSQHCQLLVPDLIICLISAGVVNGADPHVSDALGTPVTGVSVPGPQTHRGSFNGLWEVHKLKQCHSGTAWLVVLCKKPFYCSSM
jgi:hypothetical protein